MTGKRVYRVVVHTRLGGARQVYLIPRKGYSYRRGKTGRAKMTAPEVEQAKRWAKRRAARDVRVIGPTQWPFLVLGDTAWPTNKRLLRALNTTGRRRRRMIKIVSGLRTPREAWELRMRYLDGTGNTAARCCTKYSGAHTWSQCGKNPLSNHASGNAADCGTVTSGGLYRSLANDTKARRIFESLGGCFPVRSPQWEPWHAEMRNR